jgi:hypothetical protein
MLFLGMLYRLISFLSIYIASSASLPAGVCVYMGVAMGVMDGVWLMRVLLVVMIVCKISIRVDFWGLWVCNIGLSVA